MGALPHQEANLLADGRDFDLAVGIERRRHRRQHAKELLSHSYLRLTNRISIPVSGTLKPQKNRRCKRHRRLQECSRLVSRFRSSQAFAATSGRTSESKRTLANL